MGKIMYKNHEYSGSKKLGIKYVTASTAESVTANGGTHWFQIPFPSDATPICICGYYLNGGSGCSVYAMYLTDSYASFALRNGSTTNASVIITCYYLCEID